MTWDPSVGVGQREATACPDENALAAFVEGKLAAAAHQALEAHLDTCSACLGIVCEMARSAVDGEVAGDAATVLGSSREDSARVRPLEPRRGDRVGRYRLLEMVGQGAMGSVYAAHDTTLDRRVALKVLRSDRLELPEARARMLREARAMAKVSDPNVVTVHDAGEIDRGVFVAMEFVAGLTLAAWLRERRRPWREVLAAFFAAGRGLVAAHASGVVHRDFKPENVLVDRNGRVAVTDFGLAAVPVASVTRGPGATSPISELTRPGALLGTPSYMSPEQLAGEKVDARTDQFSFAVALYEGLHGRKPFAGRTVEELRVNIARGRVDAGRAEVVPAPLRRALLRALSVRPSERFPDMDALLRALDEGSVGGSGRLARPRYRVAGVICALVLVVGASVFLVRRREPRRVADAVSAPARAEPAPFGDGPAPSTAPALPDANGAAVPSLAGPARSLSASASAAARPSAPRASRGPRSPSSVSPAPLDPAPDDLPTLRK